MIFRIALCAALCLAANLNAQVSTGTIVGVVEDITGAVIPSARVTIVHVATAESRQTRSNERGEFSLPYVRIGEYTVSAEADGFKKEALTGIGKIHPDFYPAPVAPPVQRADGTKHFERLPDGFLTKDDFTSLCDTCADILHARDPFSTEPPVIQIGYRVDEWVARIQKLLALHFVSICGSQ